MRTLMVLAALLFALPTSATAQQCWSNLGTKQDYDPAAQLAELRQLVEHHDCPVLAMMWRLEISDERRSVLLWDAEAGMLWRIHAGDREAQWEAWSGSSKDAILSEAYAGVISRAAQHGFGTVPLTEEAKHFLTVHAAGLFAAAI